jgi:hypothetical protein
MLCRLATVLQAGREHYVLGLMSLGCAVQKRRMTPAIKREMRRRSAVKPVICHIKNDHRMERSYLAGQQGGANNAVLAAAGYNFRLLLNWLRLLLCLIASLMLIRSHVAVRLQVA